ncbi:MAG: hypothetical protein HC930_07260 [Hydrococcus sp. SU_1_0]|nr:hypothetical protein [Hydrococcus sp. SU_1_0]
MLRSFGFVERMNVKCDRLYISTVLIVRRSLVSDIGNLALKPNWYKFFS